MEIFAAAFVTLYTAHHVGDYWVQTDHQARHKGDAGPLAALQCWAHVFSYLATQVVFLFVTTLVTGLTYGVWQLLAALAVSGLTHYAADRREHGALFWLARRLPGKGRFLELGVPRPLEIYARPADDLDARGPVPLDIPTLGTGAWALDQSWHLVFSVFAPALVLAL